MEPIRVLLIEDHALLRQAVAEYLMSQGYAVTEVASHEEAAHWVDIERFDCIVTDYITGCSTSERFMQQVRRSESRAASVVVLSGLKFKEGLPGVKHVMGKPFSFEDLRKAMRAPLWLVMSVALGSCAAAAS